LVDWLAMSRYNYGRRVTYSLLMLQIDRESEMAAKTMLILLLAYCSRLFGRQMVKVAFMLVLV